MNEAENNDRGLLFRSLSSYFIENRSKIIQMYKMRFHHSLAT